MVGGTNYGASQYNRITQAFRQPGSIFKPFVYLAALMQPDRYNLGTVLQDEPIELESPPGVKWAPQNYDKQAHGEVPLFAALAQSYNFATVRLGLDIGVNNVREIFRAAGMLEDPPAVPALPPQPRFGAIYPPDCGG